MIVYEVHYRTTYATAGTESRVRWYTAVDEIQLRMGLAKLGCITLVVKRHDVLDMPPVSAADAWDEGHQAGWHDSIQPLVGGIEAADTPNPYKENNER